MNERLELKAKLDEAIFDLRTKCDDKDAFDALMDKILSLKGQVDVEPMRLCVPESDVLREHKSDTYYIAETKGGVIYHSYGGYTIMASNRNATSLFEAIRELERYLEDKEGYINENMDAIVEAENVNRGEPMTDEEVEEFKKSVVQSIDTDFVVKEFLLKLPWWCFCDVSATYGIAETAFEQFKVLVENSEKDLLPEDTERNDIFNEAFLASETLNKELKE